MKNSDQIKTEPLEGLRDKKTKKPSFWIEALKYLLLGVIVFFIGDGAYEVWKNDSPLYWKLLVDFLSLFFITLIIFLWNNISSEIKVSVLFLFFVSLIAFSTSYFGTFQNNYTILNQGTDFLSVLLLILGTLTGIIFIILFRGLSRPAKIILLLTGLYVLAGNLHIIITRSTLEQGFNGIWLWKVLPLYLRPTIWTIFYFLPLTVLLIIYRIIVRLIKKEKGMTPFVLPLLSILIITAMGFYSFYMKTSLGGYNSSYEGLIGSLNILSRTNGGSLISYTTQYNLYDNAAFRLNDGEIDPFSPFKWSSAEKVPFPHQITFALGKPEKEDAFTVNRIIIYNAKPSDNTGVKEFELYLSMEPDKRSFALAGKFTCKNSPCPGEFKFKPQKARFAKISILSNFGNETRTELTEVEIFADKVPLKPANISKNIVSEEKGGRIVSYSGIESEENISVRNLIKSDGLSTGGTWKFKGEKLPQEIIFRLGYGETFLIDKILLAFPFNEKSNIKDIEILASPKELNSFTTVWKYTHDQNKTEEVFSFPPVLVSYIKLRVLSTYEEGKPYLARCAVFQSIIPQFTVKASNKILPGLQAFYYSGLRFKDLIKEIRDEKLDFYWKDSPPFPEMDKDNYFINWKGYLSVPKNGLYEIGISAGGGFRLYLNNEKVMENTYSPSVDYWNTSYFNLPEGYIPLEIYYYKIKSETSREGGIKLAWKKPEEKEYKIITGEYLGHIPSGMKRTSKESVQYGIDWLTQGALKWQEKNKCYGCHVQGQAIMGLSTGNTYKIDTNSLNLMCDYLRGGELGDGTLQFEKSNSIAAAQFFGMSMAYYDKYKGSSDKTGLINIAKWLLSKQQSDGSWRIDELEPPLQQGDIMVTANSLFTIKQACLYDTSQPWNDSITKGLLWLQSSEAKTIQDLIFKILGLSFTGQTLDNPVIKKDVEILFSKQNSDGGWSETQDLKSNNLTTGMAVYALKCAGINMNDERLIKGVSYLINNQQAFGSWPSENTISKRPSDYGPTAWAIAGLIDSSETLTIKIKYPIEEEKKTIEAEVFNSTFSHISYVAFYLDEKLLGKITKHPYYIVLPESSLSPGKHKIKVTVNTDDGQSVSDEKEVNFQGPLKIAIIKPEKAISLETFIEVDIKNKSDSKIKSVDYFLNEKTIGKVEESPYNLKFNTKNIPDGTYELKVIVSDSKGLQAFDSKTINIKKTFSLEIIDPGNGRDISEEKYKIRVKVINETGYSTEKIDYYIDGKPAGSSSKEPYDMEYDFSTIPGGDHELTAIAVNENNDKAEGKITFRLDKGLMIKIKKPEGGNIITGNTKIQSEVLNKTKSPVTMVEYFLNNNPAGKVFKDLYSLELQDLKQGNYKLKAVVYTKDGGKAFDEIEIEVRQHVEALITATVVDKNGKYISEIDPKSFILKEDNVEQNPLVVLSGEDIGHPSIVIIIDESKSIETSIEKVKEAANNFISMVDDKTRISVIFYSDSLRVNDFTTDKNKLKNTISTLKAHGGSVLYDSIYKASEILMKEKERKAIVLLTDGIDENDSSTGPGSKHNFLETVKYAKENNILIYTIGFKPTADKKLLETYSVETGGIFYFSPTVNDLTEIYKQLAGIFKCQYMIAYRSSNFKRDGSWRKVTINIKDNPEYKVITSGGYKEPVY